MNKACITAIALLAVSPGANAALITLGLAPLSVLAGNPSGPPTPGFVTGFATWTFDSVTNQLTQTGSNAVAFYDGAAVSSNLVYSWDLSSLSISGAGVASASAYVCHTGPFATLSLKRNDCAGYDFGTNGVDESLVSASGVFVTLGGDDALTTTPAQTLANNFNMIVRELGPGPGLYVRKTTPFAASTAGAYQLAWVVPIPAAGWLLGTALGLLGIYRRFATG